MAQNMKVSGKMTLQMARDDLFMLMETFIKVTG
jgi:hypothetical protein